MANGTKRKKNKKKRVGAARPDRHLLYSAAVQSPEADLDFFERVYKKTNGTTFQALREDFCGTAFLACEWVKRRAGNRSLGVDLDEATLDWGRRRNLSVLGEGADRVELMCADVRDITDPKVDVVAAQNFSYCVFKTRSDLGGYLRQVRRSLRNGGLVFLDVFGGTDAICDAVEKRRIGSSEAFDGTRVPAFTYVWEQAKFNPVDHHTTCYIHFKLKNGKKLNRAFRYDWRLWTLPELRELLIEAGFAEADVYIEGWDDEADDTDGVFRRRSYFENMSGWVAYIIGRA